MRGDGTTNLVFSTADCAVGGGRDIAADGRQLDAGVGGAFGALGVSGADHCHHAVVVPGAGFAVARASPHFVEREGRAGAGHSGTLRFILARTAFEVGAGTARILGVAVAAWRSE